MVTSAATSSSIIKRRGLRTSFFCRILYVVALLSEWSIGSLIAAAEEGPSSTGSSRLSRWIPSTSLFQKKRPSLSSWLTVDPSKILQILVQKGGLLVPKSVEKELNALTRVCHCDESKLNVVDRQLLVRNFTVSLPRSNENSLRVGRVSVKWDSYIRPCVEVEVEDVDILVEFVNLLLTRNNWNELRQAGFPPEMMVAYMEDGSSATTSTPSSTTSSFIRIGAIDLSGRVVVRIRSRPLDKQIAPDQVLDLKALNELNDNIRKASESNRQKTGRVGLDTEELYDQYQSFFGNKLRSFLKSTAYDLASSRVDPEKESVTAKQAKRAISGARDILVSYAQSAGERLQDQVDENINKYGAERLGQDKLARDVRAISRATIGSITGRRKNETVPDIVTAQWKWIQTVYRSVSDATAKLFAGGDAYQLDTITPDNVEVFFPDW